MSAEPKPSGSTYDPESVHAKYLAERDKRLVPGRAVIRDLATDDHFARYTADPFTPYAEREPVTDDVDAIVVGAGMAGLLAAVQLQQAGLSRIRLVDIAGGAGGTWYWNRYPGVMCDVESYVYLPMLEETGYVPKDRYSSGEEIRLHLESIAERHDLLDDALFHTTVSEARWDDDAARWRVTTDRGDTLSSKYYVLAVGILSLMKLPAIPGMERFAGHSFHSARWDYEYTGGGPGEPMTRLGDKVVGVMGTGATGIQCVPPLVEAAKHVYVFQRTPSAIGVRGNRPTDPAFAEDLAPGWQQDAHGQPPGDHARPAGRGRPHRRRLDPPLRRGPQPAAAQGHEHRGLPARGRGARLRDHGGPPVAGRRGRGRPGRGRGPEALLPLHLQAAVLPRRVPGRLQRTQRHPRRLPRRRRGDQRAGRRWSAAEQYDLDCLIYATGFEPEITPLARRAGHEIVGRGGVTLAEHWAEGPQSLFGLMVRGLPNLFVMPSPAQQAVVTVNYTQLAVFGAQVVGRTVQQLEARGARCFEVSEAAEQEWTDTIVGFYVDGSRVMSACTPSRINQEGDPGSLKPRNGNYGRGLGDYFAYRERLEGWLDDGELAGLEVG